MEMSEISEISHKNSFCTKSYSFIICMQIPSIPCMVYIIFVIHTLYSCTGITVQEIFAKFSTIQFIVHIVLYLVHKLSLCDIMVII